MKRIVKKNYSSTYIKLLISIIMIIDITIFSFAMIMYGYYRISSKKEIDSLNTEIVTLVQNNLDYLSELVDNYVMSEFYREDTEKLMNTKIKLTSNETNVILNRITAAKQLQSLVDDVCIYNGNLNEYYAIRSEIKESIDLKHLMENKELRAFKPYLIFDDVLTYIVFKSKNSSGRPDGAMIVNIKLSWLKQFIKSNNVEYTNMYLTDCNGKIILDINSNLSKGAMLERKYTASFPEIRKEKKDCIYQTDENDLAVAYSFVSSLDMVFVIERDYKLLYNGVYRVCRGMGFITFIFLILGVLISFFAGDHYYAPIRELIKNMRMFFEKEDDCDDFEYLENVMMRLKGGTEIANSLTKTNLMREFLTNPLFFDNKTKEQYICEEAFFDGTSQYCMLILDAPHEAENIKKYFIKNTASKYGDLLSVEKTDTETLLVLKNTGGEPLINFLKNELENYDGVFVFVSEETNQPESLAKIYERSKILLKYRILFEHTCCLSEKEIKIEERKENNQYPMKMQNRILEVCKTGKTEEMDIALAEFMCEIKNFTYENYCMALMRVIFMLMQEYSFLADENLQKTVFSMKDMQEIKHAFHEAFNIISVKNNSSKSMNKSVIDSMKEYIELNISDFELCSKSIAAEFNMSAVYVGRLFRESEQISIADYITNLRMKTAVKLLTSTTASIALIMEKVGYDNKSKFYRHFKAYYRTTPKEYRIGNFEIEKLNQEVQD